MNLRGLQKFSLIDYPGKLACVAFAGGCNYRCPYCHNPCLVCDPESQPEWSCEALLAFLAGRRGKLDGVVFSGGEPTLQTDLAAFCREVRELGFLIKIDTNGSHPERLREIRPDALGIDCKAPWDKYPALCGGDPAPVRESIAWAVRENITLDVRTTVHRALLSETELFDMREQLLALGVRQWTLQQFHVAELLDTELAALPTWSDRELRALAARLGPAIQLRGVF